MEKDYYRILSLPRTATEEEIRRQYRRLSTKWHPDKNEVFSKEVSEINFREVAEAFEVLNDPKKRALFDQFGSEGLKRGVCGINGALLGGYQFCTDPKDMYERMCGKASPFGDTVLNGNVNGSTEGPWRFVPAQSDKKVAPLVQKIRCTLEELHRGAVKKVCVQRKRFLPDRKTTHVEDKQIALEIRPGWRHGTKVTFAGEGNEELPYIPAGDLVLEIETIGSGGTASPFERAGDDLIYTHKVSLIDALCGHVVQVTRLDGSILSVSVPEVAGPKHERRIPHEGMLKSDGVTRGDMIIRFDIEFPSHLVGAQKDMVRKALMMQGQ
eukprot:GDKI01010330.1.p1 GENE.GDKI01010330.1~~GDKI01010330.1.p1  ORF type:complete len:325 (-),score=81.90 GDKI01010330.1:31-1005(-)